MTPSSKWFPTNLHDQAAWFTNFNNTMQGGLGTTLGFTAPELVVLGNDTAMFDYLADTMEAIDAFVDAVRTYRRVVTEGNVGDPTPTLPPDFVIGPPSAVPTGIFERLDTMVKRIRTAPAFTEETGAALGINPKASSGGPHGPIHDVPPVIKGSVDPGHVIEVKFTRGSSDGIYIEKNVNNGGWAFAEKAFKSPAVFAVPGDGIPQGVQLRARWVEGNNPTGDWSDIVTVQTIP